MHAREEGRKVHNALDDKGFKLMPDLRQEYNKSSNPKAFTYCKRWTVKMRIYK